MRSFTYGERVRDGLDLAQDDGLTDIGGLFREVQDRFGGPDLGAVIIDGDGIQNRGRDPRTEASRLGVPVYTIALGDTTVRPDLAMKGVEHNRYTYLGNDFPLLVRLQADHLRGQRASVSVERDGRELARKEVAITGDPWYGEVPLLLTADKAGLQRYVVMLRALDGEASLDNNREDVFVEVLDDRRKVLLLAEAPHPDVAAMRKALMGLEGYATDLALAAGPPPDLSEYDLVVLHGLPTVAHPLNAFLMKAERAKLPLLAVVSATTDRAELSDLGIGVSVTGARRSMTEAQGDLEEGFALFTLEPDQARALERFPPLQVPFGQYQASRGAEVMLRQRIGVVRTEQPLIALDPTGERRMGAICGEGLWRWRLADQQQSGGTEHFDALMHKLVQFLAVHADRSRFRVNVADLFAENEPVRMEAELYNASYEPVNDPEAEVVLTDGDGRSYPYVFSRVGSAYRLEVPALPPGTYTYRAQATLDEERQTVTGTFTVQALQVESRRTVADHDLWADLAVRTGGRMVGPTALDSLEAALAERPEIADRSYTHATFSDLVGRRWILFVLMALLALEWALRRRAGGY